jgi:Zn-dependent protease with chaperone function
MNLFKTFVLLAALTALFVGLGYLLGGPTGMLIALVLVGGMNLVSYWNADKIVLKMYRAQPVDEQHSNAVVRAYVDDVVQMARNAGLPRPVIAIIPNDQPNAFATGRNPENAAVAATTGIIRVLSTRELRGVMAHELAHVKHRDILISTISATMAGSRMPISRMRGILRSSCHSSPDASARLLGSFFSQLMTLLQQTIKPLFCLTRDVQDGHRQGAGRGDGLPGSQRSGRRGRVCGPAGEVVVRE